eukprot:1585671-Prymnesium_polylepis.1
MLGVLLDLLQDRRFRILVSRPEATLVGRVGEGKVRQETLRQHSCLGDIGPVLVVARHLDAGDVGQLDQRDCLLRRRHSHVERRGLHPILPVDRHRNDARVRVEARVHPGRQPVPQTRIR